MTDNTDLPDQRKGKIETGGFLVEFFRKPGERPWVTYLAIGVCAAICAYFNLPRESSSHLPIAEFLVPSSFSMWSGAYWGLLTSAFVHFEAWHIFFNMWWLKDFGALLELTLGRPKYSLFIMAAAVVSSGAELAVTSRIGIGFSGVVYAMFGYLLAARRVQPAYQQIITRQTIIWLLGWIILCIVLTYAKVLRVANATHVAGFLFGYCVGNAFTVQVRVALNKTALAVLAAVTVLSVAYMPWSETWKHRAAYAGIIAVSREAEAGNPEAQYNYSGILAQYGKKEEAISWLRKSAYRSHVPAMNALAWILATDRDDAFRGGPEAVKLAEKACERDNWKEAAYVDTLAAAYAEVERWDDAVRTQKLAISRLAGETVKTKASFEARLRNYSQHEKVRE